MATAPSDSRTDTVENEKMSNDKSEGATRIQGINRRLILDAALEVFSAYGFRGSTVDQIAEKAGMSKPNLLYYFPRKQNIYVTVLEDTLATWLEPFEHINPDGDPLEELRRYIAVKLEMSAKKPEASRLFANEILHGAPAISDFLKGHLKQLVDEKAAVIHRWIAEKRLAPVDPYHLIFTIWAVTQHYSDFSVQVGAVLGRRSEEAGFYDETAKAVSAIILDGIRPRNENSSS
ncbi:MULTISPECIES: HTH-type transcriptional regulator RutR [Brucella/Ochrobactrum group]|jgi:TetR/AcrR family transcriptional regulator|uniref:Transcriptional regulator, TetR family n=3 Tax=Brucella/Ochrobactrum group TaxID=2826938 RepID=A6WVS6_BRUA4|nr:MULTISPECIES: HTH-type transcriptional regulator RutR [Brucella/Ochrobactrum group]ABS84242.1 putative transcriptional regulator [Ochrobactrum sp. G21]MCR5940987.1 HTH-type transcriptional regulator RutR [Ochrobactrum sp. XJ1]QTN01927.1 HTH-type transcriptional regulator RutR [Ochrobactrum sp. EEELCW01]RNL42495.1 HTH-type transcriptional regulator RutR [Ochrobactrum sp. MH181795]ABS13080.1 transcriptional regulator, TetR family [Brucella anthropi ATCC 49188]